MNLQLEHVETDKRVILERLLQFKLYEGGMEPGADGHTTVQANFIEEFFVLRPYRRHGRGILALCCDCPYRGEWTRVLPWRAQGIFRTTCLGD